MACHFLLPCQLEVRLYAGEGATFHYRYCRRHSIFLFLYCCWYAAVVIASGYVAAFFFDPPQWYIFMSQENHITAAYIYSVMPRFLCPAHKKYTAHMTHS